ncbi:MAG: hypothetical protein U0793_24795 [Gemmataceae bacterium]
MSHYPPKLIGLSGTDLGSLLFLDDGTQVTIDVRLSRLNEVLKSELLTEYGALSLHDLVKRHSVDVFVGQLLMTADRWDTVRDRIRSSVRAGTTLSRFPLLWASFDESYGTIAARAHRLYGGLSRSLYTSCPIDFREDPNRPLPWYRALLSAAGGWLCNTWVNLGTGTVEIEAEQHPGHFVE